jgi:peroxiredoxin
MTRKNQTLRAGDTAPDFEMIDGQGQTLHLSDTWRDGPVLLSFIRHFG